MHGTTCRSILRYRYSISSKILKHAAFSAVSLKSCNSDRRRCRAATKQTLHERHYRNTSLKHRIGRAISAQTARFGHCCEWPVGKTHITTVATFLHASLQRLCRKKTPHEATCPKHCRLQGNDPAATRMTPRLGHHGQPLSRQPLHRNAHGTTGTLANMQVCSARGDKIIHNVSCQNTALKTIKACQIFVNVTS